MGWAQDTRDSALAPNRGSLRRINAAVQLVRNLTTVNAFETTVSGLGFTFGSSVDADLGTSVHLHAARPSGDAEIEPFTDPPAFKKLLVADMDKFNAAFVEKLATYAIRRTTTLADHAELAKIAAKGKAADYKLAATIEALVLSDLFQHR